VSILFVGVFVFTDKIVDFYVDLLWFENLGFESVLWTTMAAELSSGLLAGGLFFLLTFPPLRAVYRQTQHLPIILGLDLRREIPFLDMIIANLRAVVLLTPLGLAVLTGLVVSKKWETFFLYLYQVPFNQADPIFAKDYSFYLFTLPFLNLVNSILWEALWVAGIGSCVIHFFKRSVSLRPGKISLLPEARKTLSAIAGFTFALLAADFFLKRYDLLISGGGIVAGIGYADDNGRLPLLILLACVAGVGSVLSFLNLAGADMRKVVLPALSLGILYIGGNVYPLLLKKFVVDPNELIKETKYIEHSIEGTRFAYGLKNIEHHELGGSGSLNAKKIMENDLTIQNIRLWDQEPLLDTLGQIQEIRTYYEFNSVDNDRYTIGGKSRQTLLSPRELLSTSLPNRTWINEHLTFTHGYGVSLSPVNMVTPEGMPVLFIKDIPPQSSVELKVLRPEIYFGELSNEHVFVNTGTKEFNYPEGEKNVYTSYTGKGGIPVQSFLRKTLFAVYFKTMKILFSNDIREDSRLLMHRKITDRMKKVAPFLHLDTDPYMVISDDGLLFWMQDAYTVSKHFPYSHSLRFGNYIRNSVKIVIDAYDGKMNFYISDPEDPVILTLARIFPGLFQNLKTMRPDLLKHTRYPADLFSVQTLIHATYHMSSPQVFYNKEDLWEIPEIGGQGMKPYYTIMKLPNKEREEYILMLPFTPRGKGNLSAWMVARSDGENYGKLVVYTFPKQKLVYGPSQIVARINQEAEISRQISMWDQRGSQVIQGNLLVIPIEESLIYVRPLYLKADTGKIPELKRVIVGYEDQIAMEQTLDEALQKIFPDLAHIAPGPARTSTPAAPTKPSTEKNQDAVIIGRDDFRKLQSHYKDALKNRQELEAAMERYRRDLDALGETLSRADAGKEPHKP
jgi:hypothetical protein